MSDVTFCLTREFLRAEMNRIVETDDATGWSLQGLGMLRYYLTEDRSIRMHVWDDRYAVGASEMHTHPWDLESLVVAGCVQNTRYIRAVAGGHQDVNPYMEQTIFCGAGGGLEGEPRAVNLVKRPVETYVGGDTYSQVAHEIHVSAPLPGTVTVVTRRIRGTGDHADVFWPYGEEWVSAEPRDASGAEVIDILGSSLAAWF